MKIMVNRDFLNRLVIACVDDDENVMTALLTKKQEDKKDLNMIYKRLSEHEKVDEMLCGKLAVFGFTKVSIALKNK